MLCNLVEIPVQKLFIRYVELILQWLLVYYANYKISGASRLNH